MSRTRPTPARQPWLREHNLALVLAEVAAAGATSRARIATATGLTKATVSTLVDSLVAAGLLRELGPRAASGVGRPGSVLSLAAGPVGVGLELNVDYLATCTLDLAGRVHRRELVAQDFRAAGPEVALARAAASLCAALEDVGRSGSEPVGICVAVPGLVEPGAGVVRLAPNLGWRDLPVAAELLRRCGPTGSAVPLRVENEANLAALGELWCGGHTRPDGAPLESFLHVSGEIGVGGALVLDGALFTGTRGFAGEIGHLPLDADGPSCRCGARGCLELYAGQEAILAGCGIRLPAGTTAGRPDGPVEELVRRAEQGDVDALAAIAAAGRALGTGIAVAVNLVDVDTVLLGGLYARLAPWLRASVQAELDRRVLAASWGPVRLQVATLGADGAVRGAATRAVRAVLADPAAWIAGHTPAR